MNERWKKNTWLELAEVKKKWHVIDTLNKYGNTFKLLENDNYGDEVAFIVIGEKDNVIRILEWEWLDTLEEWWDYEWSEEY